MEEPCTKEAELEEIEDYSDIFLGREYGYYKILKKAGRNRNYQQRYIVRCKCCQQIFTRTLYKIKEAEGETQCKHTRRTRKPVCELHPCEHCGEMTTNLKYCSASCRTAATNVATKTKPMPKCLYCGKPTSSRTQTLCSDECRHLHRIQSLYGGKLLEI